MTPDALLDDLKRPWRHGEHVDARSVVLDDPLVLDGLEVRGFDLSAARLNGGLSARGTLFRGLAWLRGARIEGPCDLSRARFRTDLRADGLIAGDVRLDGCHLEGVLSLAGARVASLSLARALIMANVTLQEARVDRSVDLAGAEIMGGLWTAGATMGVMDREDAEVSGRLRLPQ
ncbi:pentapeptide repeat-containing protein [Gymnodinialimonas sp.]